MHVASGLMWGLGSLVGTLGVGRMRDDVDKGKIWARNMIRNGLVKV